MKTLIFIFLLLVLGIKEEDNHISEFDVIDYVANSDIKHKEIVLSQIFLETGYLGCSNCSMDYNNLFGFLLCNKRDSLNKCIGWYYLKFDSWEESIDYYKRWQDKYYKGGNYYTFLKNIGFAQDPEYIKKLKSIKIKLK